MFPDNAAKVSGTNDFPIGTAFHSVKLAKVSGATVNYILGGNAISLGAGGFVDEQTAGLAAISIPISLAQDTTFSAVAGDHTTYFSGTISGAASLTKAGAGGIAITTQCFHTGGTVVSDGELYVASAAGAIGKVTVAAGGRLGLSSGATVGAVTMTGGVLAPGEGGSGLGNTGDLAFDATSGFSVIVQATTPGSYTKLSTTGTVKLADAKLTLGGNHTPTLGESFVIIANDGTDAVQGKFAGLPEGASVLLKGEPMRISYTGGDGNDVVLTAVLASTIDVTSSGSTLAPGASVTYTATIGGAGSPTGTVGFSDGSWSLAVAIENGVATFTTSFPEPGTYTISARYDGDPTHAGVSTTLTQVVEGPPDLAAAVDAAGTDLGSEPPDLATPSKEADLGTRTPDEPVDAGGCAISGALAGGAGPATVLLGLLGLTLLARKRAIPLTGGVANAGCEVPEFDRQSADGRLGSVERGPQGRPPAR